MIGVVAVERHRRDSLRFQVVTYGIVRRQRDGVATWRCLGRSKTKTFGGAAQRAVEVGKGLGMSACRLIHPQHNRAVLGIEVRELMEHKHEFTPEDQKELEEMFLLSSMENGI